MLAEIGHSLPSAVHRSAIVAPLASGLRALGAKRARQGLARNANLGRFVPHRMFSAQQCEVGKASASRDRQATLNTRTWGDKMVLLGLSMRGAAMLPQLVSVSRLLRFAGAGPMLLGSIVTIYEIGGWKLLLGIPATAASLTAIGKIANQLHAERFRSDIAHDLSVGCPNIPADLVELLPTAEVHEVETNRVRMEVEWTTSPGRNHWRIVAYGTRENMWQPWNVRTLQVSCGVEDACDFARGLPPQSRDWDCNTVPLRWEVIWQKQ